MATNRFTITALLVLLSLGLFSSAVAQRPGGGGPGRPPGGGPGGPGPGIPGGRPPGDGRFPGDAPPRRGVDGPPPRGQHPPPGPHADFLSSEMRFGDRTVKGSPYSAQFSTEHTQVLGDGTRITRKSNGTVYRTTEGRTRREQTLGAFGPVQVEGGPRQMIFINDPVGGAHYVLDVQDHTARKLPFRGGPPPPAGSPSEMGAPPDARTESLGKRLIEGVEAEGTRSTITIPVGRLGNDRPLEIVSERWYSPELQIVVLSKHNDPFSGDNVYRLTGISRNEPAPALFEVPPDYRIMEGRPPDGPRKPRQ